MVDIVTRLGKGSPLTNAEVDANFTNLAEVSGITGEPMGHEDRTTSTISFNASTRTFTIAPAASSFTVWCKGKKVVISSAQTLVIPNTTGMHSIYYDANGTLSSKIGYFTFSAETPTAYVYWNATTGAAPYFGDERHGVVLDWQTHEYLHRTRGAVIANGFLASGYTLNSSATNAATQIAIESGTFFDEDMKIDIVSTATPTAGTYQQNLLFPAKIPVLHLQGTSWVMDAPTDFPFKQGTSRPQYNSVSGGVWSTADVGNNQHATTWILATNNLTYPVIAIIGQSATDNLGEAEAFSFDDLTLTGFPSVEFRPLYKLIYKASDGYANSVNARLESIVDLRSISPVGAAANPATDHGNLSGLSDDDHPQYLSVDTVRGSLTDAVKASFLPSQTSNAGKFLQTDGTATSWQALTSSNITTALGFTPYNDTNPSGYITGITSGMVTAALGFTPYNAANLSGYVSAAGARGAISVTGAGSYDSATGVINIVGGLTSFNTRTGAITLSSADVTTALGFTPYNSTNPNGYINSSILAGYLSFTGGGTVTAATTFNGGLTVRDSIDGTNTVGSNFNFLTNRNGNQTLNIATADLIAGTDKYVFIGTGSASHVSSTTTVELGASTPGSITRIWSPLEIGGNVAIHAGNKNNYTYPPASHSHTYLPLSGGTLTGTLFFANATSPNTNYIQFGDNTGWALRFMTNVSGTPTERFKFTDGGAFNSVGAITQNGSQVLHAGNVSTYALPISGGTLTGNLILNGTSYIDVYGALYLREHVYSLNSGSNGWVQIFNRNGGSPYINNVTYNGNVIIHAGNKGSYTYPPESHSHTYLPLTGGALTGNVSSTANGFLTLKAIGSGTFNVSTMFLDTTICSWEAPITTDSSTGTKVPFVLTWRGGYGTQGGLKLTGGASGELGGNVIIHAGNKGSYTYPPESHTHAYLPLSGGTMTGNVTLDTGNGEIIVSPTGWRSTDRAAIKIRSKANTPAEIDLRHTVGGVESGWHISARDTTAASELHLYRFNMNSAGAADSAGSFVQMFTFRADGSFNTVGAITQNGNQVLHAGNYNSYAPTLTGGGASGTWGISITGSAGSVSGFKSFGSIYINPNGANANCTTAQFMTHLTNLGFFNYAHSVGKCAWDYAGNNDLTDTGFGTVDMAGCVIETWVNGSEKHVRVTRPTTGAGGFQVLVYVDHGSGYSPGWRSMITSENIGSFALPLSGGDMSGRIRMGSFPASTNNTGEAWIGRASDRATGTMTVQLGNSADRVFEVVDNPWSTVIFNAGMNSFLYKGSAILHAGNYSSYALPISGGTVSGAILIGPNSSGRYTRLGGNGGATDEATVSASNGNLHIDSKAGGNGLYLNYYNSSGPVYANGANQVLHAGNYTSYSPSLSGNYKNIGVGGLYSRYNYNESAWITDATAASTLSPDYGTTTVAMHNSHGSFSNWATTLTMSGYERYGAYQISGNYNTSTAELAVRNYYQGTSTWTSWIRLLSSANYSSYALPLSGGTVSGSVTVSESYTNGWFRNNNSNQGLYNQSTGGHFCSLAAHAWQITGNGGGVELQFRANHNSTIRGYVYGDTGNNFGLLHNGGGWAVQVYPGGTGYLHSTWTGGNIKANRANGNLYIDDNYGYGIVGVYSSYRYQGVFAMGDSYKLPADGTTTGSLYGMAWSHPNAGGAAGNLTDHGLLIINNGGFRCAISNSIVASANITAYSDERLKTNWRDMPENYVARLAQVKVGIYDRIDEEDTTQVGVSAQSFQQLLPQAIMTANDEMQTLSVSYGNAALASAVELAKDNVELRARVERLESLINKLIGD